MSDVPVYGTPTHPYPETPPAASLYSVGWASGAILFDYTHGYVPFAFGICPGSLPARGSWCTWLYCVSSPQFQYGDGFRGLQDDVASGYKFAGEVSIGFVEPTYDPPYYTDIGLFSRFSSQGTSTTGKNGWVIRPPDSFATTRIVPFDPADFYYRDDQSVASIGHWHLFQMSWIVGGAGSMAIDDVVQSVVFEPYPFIGFWDGDVLDAAEAISPAPPRVALVYGTAGHMDWWLSTEYIDWTETKNRRRFIAADKKKIALNADGSSGSPTGRKPEFYFRPGANLADFSRNRGTGGPITWTTEADYPNPADPSWSSIKTGAGAG